jgi:hypothetical protein
LGILQGFLLSPVSGTLTNRIARAGKEAGDAGGKEDLVVR